MSEPVPEPGKTTAPKRRQPRARPPFDSTQARAQLLAKLNKAGPKGTPSLYPASTPPEKKALLEEALTTLEAEQQIFRDTRRSTPRFFAWAHRPALPTAADVAETLITWAIARYPLLATTAELTAIVKKHPDQRAFVPAALTLLVQSGRLLALLLKSGKSHKTLYIAPPAPSGAPAAENPDLAEACRILSRRSGFPAVPISQLQAKSGASLAQVHAWLTHEAAAGRLTLSTGDWSLADEARRAAALTLHGERYLLCRLLS